MITVIQACKQKDCRYQKDIAGLNHILEVLTPEGSCPSLLRNKAAKMAKGEILLFLDDDSEISQQAVDRYIEVLSNKSVKIAGGPAEIREGSPFKKVLGSFLATGLSCARYRATGKYRNSSEQELILCNLAMRKDYFLSTNGFSEDIYPWEENDFLIKASRNNVKMVYDPLLRTTRGMTTQLSVFLKKIFSYGENRGKFSGLNKLVYIGALIFLPILFMAHYDFIKIVLGSYLFIVFTEGLFSERNAFKAIEKTVYTFLIHVTYSTGLWSGVLKRLLVKKRFRHFLYSRN